MANTSQKNLIPAPPIIAKVTVNDIRCILVFQIQPLAIFVFGTASCAMIVKEVKVGIGELFVLSHPLYGLPEFFPNLIIKPRFGKINKIENKKYLNGKEIL